MHELLVMRGVSLVGIVEHQVVVIGHDERLPDIGVCGAGGGAVTIRDVRCESPGRAAVRAGVEVDGGAADVAGDGVSGAEDCAGGEGADGRGELVEEGLVAQTLVVDGVGDAGDFGPGAAVVGATKDWEVGCGRVGAVIFPGGEDGAGGEEEGARVEGARLGVVGRRGEDREVRYGTGVKVLGCWSAQGKGGEEAKERGLGITHHICERKGTERIQRTKGDCTNEPVGQRKYLLYTKQ